MYWKPRKEADASLALCTAPVLVAGAFYPLKCFSTGTSITFHVHPLN